MYGAKYDVSRTDDVTYGVSVPTGNDWENCQEACSQEHSSGSRSQWYAIHTHARHEKKIAVRLQEQGLEVLVPTVREVRNWSDRKKIIETPLFPCYALIRAVIGPELQSLVLRHPGVLRWINCQGRPLPIPDQEIDSLQAVLHSQLPVGPHAFLKAGRRVRIRGGSLDGVEGILLSHCGGHKLVVSVQLIHKSIAIPLEGYSLEPVA